MKYLALIAIATQFFMAPAHAVKSAEELAHFKKMKNMVAAKKLIEQRHAKPTKAKDEFRVDDQKTFENYKAARDLVLKHGHGTKFAASKAEKKANAKLQGSANYEAAKNLIAARELIRSGKP